MYLTHCEYLLRLPAVNSFVIWVQQYKMDISDNSRAGYRPLKSSNWTCSLVSYAWLPLIKVLLCKSWNTGTACLQNQDHYAVCICQISKSKIVTPFTTEKIERCFKFWTKAVEIHSVGPYGHQRKLLAIIRNYEAAFFKRTQGGTKLYLKHKYKYQTPNGRVKMVTDTALQKKPTDNLFQEWKGKGVVIQIIIC